MSKNYSVAQLKRDAKDGNLRAVMTVRFGEQVAQEDLPERMRGARKIVGANSNSLMFEDAVEAGKTSMLALPKAALVEYTEDYLRIFAAGYREPNPGEQAVLDAWQAIENTEEFRQRAEYDALTDGSSTYWQEVSFFRDKGMEYLMGFEKQRGLSVDINRRNRGEKAFIMDENIRGEVALEYKLERVKTFEEVLANATVRSRQAGLKPDVKVLSFVDDIGYTQFSVLASWYEKQEEKADVVGLFEKASFDLESGFTDLTGKYLEPEI